MAEQPARCRRWIIAKATKSVTLFTVAMLAPSLSHAIDNPEAPDYVTAFEQRGKPYEDDLAGQSSNLGISQASGRYLKFLDGELNSAYQSLAKKLSPAARAKLTNSEKAWLIYFKSENDFIDENWVPENFGSSYVLSRAQYRTNLLKERVRTLLDYLRNYPGDN